MTSDQCIKIIRSISGNRIADPTKIMIFISFYEQSHNLMQFKILNSESFSEYGSQYGTINSPTYDVGLILVV